MAAVSHVADSHKRHRPSHAFSADFPCHDHSDNCLFSSCKKTRVLEVHHLPSRDQACVCASSPLACNTDYADTADSSTGSSCFSSLPSYESSFTEQPMLYCMSIEDEAESCCGGEGASSDVDIACFLKDEVGDDANNESFSFNPETIFVDDAGSTDFGSDEARFIGCSSAENGSWFLNDLDSHGQAFLNEVLDQEWMAAAVANLEKLNDTLSADSCVLHLFELDHTCMHSSSLAPHQT